MRTGESEDISFGGTSYLSMHNHPDFLDLVYEGMKRYGVNHGASRTNNISLDIYAQAETEASSRFHSEDAIMVSSGYLAAQMIVQRFFRSHKLIYGPETHPALWIGEPLKVAFDFKAWIEHCKTLAMQTGGPLLLISNAVNNLHPELYDFEWLSELKPERDITVLIDDSHGIGITGRKGEGAYKRMRESSNVKLIVIASMAKGLSVDAGLILSDQSIIDTFRKSPIYVGSSPPAPGPLYAWQRSRILYEIEFQELQKNISYFIDLTKGKTGIKYEESLPVFLLEDPDSAVKLLEKRIRISSFPYPDPGSKVLNRIVINSTHSAAQLQFLADQL